MAAKAEALQADNIQELVKPLGIILPEEIPDYSEGDEVEVREEFEKEIDSLLGASDSGLIKGALGADGTSLTVITSLDEHEDDEEFATYVTGPSRSLSLTAPFRVEGLEDEELEQFIRLGVTHSYMIGFHGDRRDDYSPLHIGAGVEIPTVPILGSFGLDYREDSISQSRRDKNKISWGSNNSQETLRAFGIGIAVIQAINPEELTITKG